MVDSTTASGSRFQKEAREEGIHGIFITYTQGLATTFHTVQDSLSSISTSIRMFGFFVSKAARRHKGSLGRIT